MSRLFSHPTCQAAVGHRKLRHRQRRLQQETRGPEAPNMQTMGYLKPRDSKQPSSPKMSSADPTIKLQSTSSSRQAAINGRQATFQKTFNARSLRWCLQAQFKLRMAPDLHPALRVSSGLHCTWECAEKKP